MAQRTPARPRVFFDIDIDDWRASHARAAAFVEATNLRYGLSTDRLQDLGGSERVRVRRDLYPNDYEWSSRGPIRMKPRREVSATFSVPLSSATGVCFVSALFSPHVHSLCTFLFSLCHILSLSRALSLSLSLSLSLALALSRSLSLSLSLSQRIVFEVWPDVAPLAVKNFIALATGSKGSGASGKPLHYAGNAFHRVVQVRFLSSDSITSI